MFNNRAQLHQQLSGAPNVSAGTASSGSRFGVPPINANIALPSNGIQVQQSTITKTDEIELGDMVRTPDNQRCGNVNVRTHL